MPPPPSRWPCPAELWSSGGLAAYDKPPGCETIALDPEGGKTGACFTSRVREWTGRRDWFPVHRLDRDTSGVQLMAKGDSAKIRAERWFREREVKKLYVALCLGHPPNRRGSIRRPLTEWQGGRRPVQTTRRGGQPAETAYQAILALPRTACPGRLAASVICFSPREGRTHQIRAHAAALGHPIIGDDRYGDRTANRCWRDGSGLDRQALHAWMMRLPLSTEQRGTATHAKPDDAPPIIVSPIPPDLAAALDMEGLSPNWRKMLDDCRAKWKMNGVL